MKKILSLILTFILVLNIFAGTGIFAFATESSEECTHTDGIDNHNNVCDNCKEYLGTDELVLGENTVGMTDYYADQQNLIKFIPEESGRYEFYSTGTDYDPRGFLYNSDLWRIAYSDDTSWLPYNRDFGFVAELVAGETYYLSVTTSRMTDSNPIERTVTIVKHETHIDGNDYFNNMCDKCNAYLLDYDLELGEYKIILPDDNYYSGRFIPENDGAYKFTVDNANDSVDFYIYNDSFNSADFSTKTTENTTVLTAELTAGKTYYLILSDYANVEIEKTVNIETHTHSGGVETCQGILCDCGLYYGEAGTEHRLDTLQTCEGYECLDCGNFFGEANDNHTWLSTSQTCKGYMCWNCFGYTGEKGEHNLSTVQYCGGYKCSDCYKFYGEGTGEHTDDNADNLCNVCKVYLGDEVIVLGENTVPSTYDGIYISFTPTEDGRYHIYSTASGDNNTHAFLYDNKLFYIDSDGTDGEGNNFFLKVDLTAGETYYLELMNYNTIDETYTVIVEKHEHSVGEQYCKGYFCNDCREYYGEGNDNHNWYFGRCNVCYIACEHDSTPVSLNCVGALCECGLTYPGQTDPNVHNWYEGECLGCYTVCEHESEPIKHTCIGYLCECGIVYGNKGEDHYDGNDGYVNLCDYCQKEYLGTIDVSLGENTVSREYLQYVYVRFVPTESGVYKFYSTSEYDPLIIALDRNFNNIKYSDDLDDRNFVLYLELTANEIYYLVLYDYIDTTEIPFSITTHEHQESGNLPTCEGIFCEVCEFYYGEIDENNHIWHYGYCSFHEDIEYPKDLECNHLWIEGDCEICGISHEHEFIDNNGNCWECNEKYYFKVESNGDISYHYYFDNFYNSLQDGDIVTIYEDAALEVITEIDKKITIDLNGHIFYNLYGGTVRLYDDVKFIDSSYAQTGYADFGLFIYSAGAKVEGGCFRYIIYDIDEDFSIADTLTACTTYYNYDTGEVIDVSSLSEIRDFFYVVTNHNEKQICSGAICEDCGTMLEGEGNPYIHNFENYQVSKEATCTSHTQETAVCSWCNEETHTRIIIGTKIAHDYTPAYGKGYTECDCGDRVENKIYSGDAAREFTNKIINMAYEYLKEVVVELVEENLSFIYEK